MYNQKLTGGSKPRTQKNKPPDVSEAESVKHLSAALPSLWFSATSSPVPQLLEAARTLSLCCLLPDTAQSNTSRLKTFPHVDRTGIQEHSPL